MNKKEVYNKALNIITGRRQNAIVAANLHKEEITKKIPEIQNLQKILSQSTIKLSKLILTHSVNVEEVTNNIIEDNLQVQEKIKKLLLQHGYSENYLDTNYYCEKCHDRGYVQGDRCSCLVDLVKKISVEEFNKSTSMSASKFSDFDMSYYSPTAFNRNNVSEREIMTRIYKFCFNYADTFTKNSSSILMLGGTGLGKTHLSLSIAGDVAQKGYSVLYGSAYDFFTKLQNEHFGRKNADENTFKTIMEADLFILDDLGAEYEGAFVNATFYNIVNSRLNEGKPVIINTNLKPQEIEKRYGERISSRLLTMYKCLKFEGKDVRQQKLVRENTK